jgi:hypothetical protein
MKALTKSGELGRTWRRRERKPRKGTKTPLESVVLRLDRAPPAARKRSLRERTDAVRKELSRLSKMR